MTIKEKKKEIIECFIAGERNYGKIAEKFNTSRAYVLRMYQKYRHSKPIVKIEFWNPEKELGDFRIVFDNEGVKHIYQSKMN